MPAFMLRNDAETLVVGLLGKRCVDNFRVLARHMHDGCTVVIDEADNAKRFRDGNREKLGTVIGPGGRASRPPSKRPSLDDLVRMCISAPSMQSSRRLTSLKHTY